MPKIPDFTDVKWHSSRSDADLGRSILNGKGKSMPRMKGKLGSIDVQQMVVFVRGFQGGKQIVPDEDGGAADSGQTTPAEASRPPLPRPVEPVQARPPDAAIREGTALFRRFCARCHGADGKGTRARETSADIPDFTFERWHERRRDAELLVSVLDGKGTDMPSFRGKVTREQVRSLIVLIRGFSPMLSRPASMAPREFDARFQQLLDEFESLRRQSRAMK
jgi:mono/diheme cytochrome c family protein